MVGFVIHTEDGRHSPRWLVRWLFLFFFSSVCKGEENFNEYTIYYHAKTTHGHPGTFALLKYTEETSKRKAATGWDTRVAFGSNGDWQ